MPLRFRDKYVHAVDYGNDRFWVEFHDPHPRDHDTMPQIEELLGDYLRDAEELKYPVVPSTGGTKEYQIHEQRERICRSLLQKVGEVRHMTNEEADWTLDIVGGDSGYTL